MSQKQSKKYVPPQPPLPAKDPQLIQMVETVRKRFLEEYENNKDLYIESDVEKIRDTDFPIRRCIYGCRLNMDEAFEMLKNAMLWRKEVGFEEASPTRFPTEFYKIGALFPYECDKEGTPLLYMRFRVHRKMDVLHDPIRKFLIFNMDLLDKKANRERSWAIIFDCQGASLANVDFNLLISLIKTVKYYYSWGLRYVLVYELPWLLGPAWKVALALMPEEARGLFRLYYKNNITEVISRENLPDFMGGTCTRDYKQVPEGARSAEELGPVELGFSVEEIRRIKKHFEQYLCDD